MSAGVCVSLCPCVCLSLCLSVSVFVSASVIHENEWGACSYQKRLSGPSKLDLSAVASHPVQVLGTELGSSARRISACNC